jgi:hypothetical protein
VTPLQTLILNRLAELGTDGRPMTYREAAKRSGGTIASTTLWQVATGSRAPVGRKYADTTLVGIANALDLPPSVVRRAAGEKPTRPSEFRLPARANKLSQEQRNVVLALVKALLDNQQ